MSAPSAPAQQPPIEAVREACNRYNGTIAGCGCEYGATHPFRIPCDGSIALVAAEARAAKLEAALRFYAEPSNWITIEWDADDIAPSLRDRGDKARATLTPEPR